MTASDSRPYWRGVRYYESAPADAPDTEPAPGWRVLFDQGTAFISGPTKSAARRRIAVCGDRHPAWVKRREAWATSPQAANAVLDQLDRHRIPVQVDDVDQGALNVTDTEPANRASNRQEALW